MAKLPEDEDFDRKSAEFLDWLQQNNTIISPKIQIADLRHRSAGRGVVAVDDIDEDEEIFAITKLSILTTENSRLPAELQVQLNDPWLSLILAMTLEYQAGQDSRWQPYFDVLPATFDTLMYWTSDELKHLHGSTVVDKIGKQSADRVFTEQLLPAVRSHQSLFNAASLSNEDLLSLFHRMGSTIMAYAFDLENASQPPRGEEDGWEEESDAGATLAKGMVPLADMLNADADRNNAKLFYEEDKVVMKTIKAVKKGEELFNDYGPLPRADVLRRYGYVTDNYAQYDVLEISLVLILEMTATHLDWSGSEVTARIEYLDEQGITDDGYDISRTSAEDGPFPEELLVLLNGLILPTADFAKMKRKDKLPKAELSKGAADLLHQVIIQRGSEYDDSNEPNATALNEANGAHALLNTTKYRRQMAEQVIDGEKLVLQQAIAHLQSILSGDTGKRPADTLDEDAMHEAKRRKAG